MSAVNNAEVISVLPNKVKILVRNIDEFKVKEELLAVGSYLKIFDKRECSIIAIIDNFTIEVDENPNEKGKRERHYIIEAIPLGFLNAESIFIRGGNNIAIPPKSVEPAKKEDIQKIYDDVGQDTRFCFSKLAQDKKIDVPVDGDRFFNKHFAIVGSTGSGKSHTVAKIIQKAIEEKDDGYSGLNNSHIVIFDIHGEYKSAFPQCNYINIENLKLPYWLFNSEELGELFIESNEENSHNQVSQFRHAVIEDKRKHNPAFKENRVFFDSPIKFEIKEVVRYIKNLNNEVIGKCEGEGYPKKADGTLIEKRENIYFDEDVEFVETSQAKDKKASVGPFRGEFERFVLRLETTINNPRLSFLFKDVAKVEFQDILKQFIGYKEKQEANITIIDLSGIPFEVLSVSVSLISRIIFEYGYYYKKLLEKEDKECKTPLLLVYEETHKYAPRSSLSKYGASKSAIERIAKEGRKYGVTLCIISQRPSEVSETIFSQCNNFVSMRLTNPDDQNYVKRLLPDVLGPLTESVSVLQAGEALLIGDSLMMPSHVMIDRCSPQPSSNDIKYLQEWKKEWSKVEFKDIVDNWKK